MTRICLNINLNLKMRMPTPPNMILVMTRTTEEQNQPESPDPGQGQNQDRGPDPQVRHLLHHHLPRHVHDLGPDLGHVLGGAPSEATHGPGPGLVQETDPKGVATVPVLAPVMVGAPALHMEADITVVPAGPGLEMSRNWWL